MVPTIILLLIVKGWIGHCAGLQIDNSIVDNELTKQIIKSDSVSSEQLINSLAINIEDEATKKKFESMTDLNTIKSNLDQDVTSLNEFDGGLKLRKKGKGSKGHKKSKKHSKKHSKKRSKKHSKKKSKP